MKKMKFEAYELCPCGSELKFKFCCYQKARDAKYSKNERIDYPDSRLNHIMNNSWEQSNFKLCLGFDKEKCEGVIKGAHTIQNNRILNRLSDEGHVYHIGAQVENSRVKPVFKKISRNAASTFFGFCDFHDTELFKPIEQREYNGEFLQNFLFAFRALSLQYHKKQRELIGLRDIFKDSPDLMLEPGMVSQYKLTALDISDYHKQYELFMDNYLDSDFKQVRTIYRKLDFEIKFACSAAFVVRYDLNSEMLNDTHGNRSEEKMPSIFVTIYPILNGTNIILSYHSDDDEIYGAYFNQLESLSTKDLTKYLNFLLIEYTENIFFNPFWIDSMTETQKNSILGSFESYMNLNKKLNLILEENYYKFDLFNVKSTF
ncbi:hypothetical protein COD22_27220 [Bacillus thuringiensis]|nr:hypothetical protein COD22_27220 [Bacillus thuringiensis]